MLSKNIGKFILIENNAQSDLKYPEIRSKMSVAYRAEDKNTYLEKERIMLLPIPSAK